FHNLAIEKLENRRSAIAVGQALSPLGRIPGRTGDDAIAFGINAIGEIDRVLICEAKCLSRNNNGKIDEAHEKISLGNERTPGLHNVIEILNQYDTPEAKVWRERLARFRMDPTLPATRYDMVLYLTAPPSAGTSSTRPCWVNQTAPNSHYSGGRDLEVDEVHVEDVSGLVTSIYR
ncbi:MAG: hypothetical protein V1738_05055, partial [Patescibacteria group bacterium]